MDLKSWVTSPFNEKSELEFLSPFKKAVKIKMADDVLHIKSCQIGAFLGHQTK